MRGEVIRVQWRSAWGQSFDLSLVCVMKQRVRESDVTSQLHSIYMQSFDLLLVWTYFHCNTSVFSFQLICIMPIFFAIILTILEVERSNKVIGGQIMYERSYSQEQKGRVVTYYILGRSVFFWYTSFIWSKSKFWGHQRSMKVRLRSVIWPQTWTPM